MTSHRADPWIRVARAIGRWLYQAVSAAGAAGWAPYTPPPTKSKDK